MLLRYYIDDTPCLEVVTYARFDSMTGTAYFHTAEATVVLSDISKTQWNIFVNDMFVDGRLAISREKQVERVLLDNIAR